MNLSNTSRTIALSTVYLILALAILSFFNNGYISSIVLLVGVLIGIFAYRRKKKFALTLLYFLLPTFMLLITFYPALLDSFLTRSSNIEVYITRIESVTVPPENYVRNIQNESYQIHLLSNHRIRDVYFMERVGGAGRRNILTSTHLYDCFSCSYYVLSVRNKGNAIISDFMMAGSLDTYDFDFLNFDPRLGRSEETQKGTFGYGRFSLTVEVIEPNETLTGTIRVNRKVPDLLLKCFLKDKNVDCKTTKYNAAYLELGLNETIGILKDDSKIKIEIPNKDNETIKRYTLNKATLMFEETENSEMHQETCTGLVVSQKCSDRI